MEDQLIALESEFNQWRRTSRKGTRTPSHLRDKLKTLIPHFPEATLARRLGIHYELINQLSSKNNSAEFDTQPNFIELNNRCSDEPENQLEISFNRLNITIKGNVNDIAELLKRIIPSEVA